jgi:glycosyltransferase involved in cell wall biosynthesis
MLSIIIPTLNEEKCLPLLLEGIKRQNFDESEEGKPSSSASLSSGESSAYEIIVADAGSTDKTVEIAKSFGCKVVKGGLPAKGRNEGAKIARGDILLFTDADNIYLPEDFLKNLLEEFEKRKLDVASFPICPKGNFFDKLAYGIYNYWVQLVQRFSAYATNSVLIRRNIHQRVGGFDEEIKIAEDHFYAKTAKKFGKFGFIRTKMVLTSTRRFEKDGRLKTNLKYLIAGIYMFFFGPIKKNIFQYRFDER